VDTRDSREFSQQVADRLPDEAGVDDRRRVRHPPHDAERHRTPTLEQPLDPEQKPDSAREDFPKGTA
jgi:hypothetical protein